MFIDRLVREQRRNWAVTRLRLLDRRREAYCDKLVAQAAVAFDTPIAMLSIFKGDRQWFKAAQGMETDGIARQDGFCGHVLDHHGLLEVCSPETDPRFHDNQFVIGRPGIRYYLGAPVRLPGSVDIGTICVIDTQARSPASPEQLAYLTGLARQAAVEFEMRAEMLKGAA